MAGFIEKNLGAFSSFLERATLEDESAQRKGLFQSIDSRIKVLLFAAAIIAVSISKDIKTLSILTAAPFILAPLSKVSLVNLARRVFVFIPIFTMIIAIPALFMVRGHVVASIGPLEITSGGVKAALFITLRVTASIAYTMLLLLTTGWYRILKALQSFGLPRTVVYLVAISYRYMHLLIHNLLELLEARRSRVIAQLPFKRNLEIFTHSSAFLFFKSLHLAGEVESAMESRGYNTGFNAAANGKGASEKAEGEHEIRHVYREGGGQEVEKEPSSTDDMANIKSARLEAEDTPERRSARSAPRNKEPDSRQTDIAFELNDVLFNYPSDIKGIEIGSLKIAKGKCTVILGANGSGKSTLLKLLDALIFPERGEVEAFGNPLNAHRLNDEGFRRFFRSMVGLIFQDPDVQCFSPTVFDELAFGPEQKGLDKNEITQKVNEALAVMRIEHLSGRYPYSLSGGEKKRVAIASILTMDPEVYLMDEPTEGLDPSSEGMLIDVILELSDRGKTLVIATQDLVLARHIGDEAVVLSSDKTLFSSGEIESILYDEELLKGSGLIHAHRHPHRKGTSGRHHSHYKDI